MRSIAMRTILATAALALLTLLTGTAAAREYAWCAHYNDETGARNCGFSTVEQCRATVSGAGGFCHQNPSFVPSAAARTRGNARR
jgi:Protein of unknown function (DUF3551)